MERGDRQVPDKDGVRPLVRCLLLQRCVSKPRDRSAASRHENEPRHREVCTLAGKETDGKQVSQEHHFLDDDKGFEKKEAGEKEGSVEELGVEAEGPGTRHLLRSLDFIPGARRNHQKGFGK